MKISLIICTYMRPKSIERLVSSIKEQLVLPNEILIIDGSLNFETEKIVDSLALQELKYFKVDASHRGLTKQRNFGLAKADFTAEIICFLDDDTLLKKDYFKEIINAFNFDEKIVGVGSVAINENRWKPIEEGKKYNKLFYYQIDNYTIKEGLRNVIRNVLCLNSNLKPGKMPSFSHSRTFNYPLNNKIYEVDLLIGMGFSFRKKVFNNIKFSTYFEGYGLYEDADFSIRALKYGKNVISTKCQLYHYHDEAGRPNKFKYGKMVVINGWYVWRLKNKKVSLLSRIKWNLITLLLIFFRFTNVITSNKRKEALTESLGRLSGFIELIFNKPTIER